MPKNHHQSPIDVAGIPEAQARQLVDLADGDRFDLTIAPVAKPGHGFEYSDTGYVITGILVEQTTSRPLHEIYREYVFDPLGMDSTWVEGHEPARRTDVAHHYSEDLDWTTVSPTIDWAGGGPVTTARISRASYTDCGRIGSSPRKGSRS
jgi:D-alanyl-D-alanine carboxypeptidase